MLCKVDGKHLMIRFQRENTVFTRSATKEWAGLKTEQQ